MLTPPPPVYPDELKAYTNHQQPTVLYNRMIYPFVPYAMRGAIWYQGEANLGDGALYTQKMQALLNQRTPIYESCADYTVDTNGKSIDEVAREIIGVFGLPLIQD